MKGFIFVAPEGCKTDKALGKCLALALEFSRTLPDKKLRRKKPNDESA